MNGISIKTLKEIQVEFGDFEIKQVFGGSYDIYLRFGYWRRVDVNKLQQIIGNTANVVEDDDYDDECGWLFSYKLK